jgi:pimeloyl-ACP methyl ester carboxylesterase
MTSALRGPWKTLAGPGGASVPFYVIPFDKAGTCTGPRSLDHLVEAAGQATDVFVFSHGWNNDWKTATDRYDRFVAQFAAVRRAHWDPPGRDYRPVLVGVFWPSTALVAPGERGPDIAGAVAQSVPDELVEIDAVADALGGAPPARLYDLAQRDRLSAVEAEELVGLLAPALAGQDDDLGREDESVSAVDLLKVWSRIPPDGAPMTGEPGGFIDEPAAPPDAAPPRDARTVDPQTAGWLDKFDPRQIVRTATVLLMKDRAGRVGARGVADMLRLLVAASDTSRVHLVGHSYGGKVVLSALCHGGAPGRQVESVLLLQPAMSALCFARDTDGKGRPGGYRSALERSRQPVVTTFSGHDVPLTKLFQWAVRRPSDLGEAVIAGAPPSRFAALGGFGPQGVSGEVEVVDALAAPHRYELSTGRTGGRRIIAVRADDVIGSHGNVESSATAWALLNQVIG